jgi:hypothetical protein
MLVFWPLMLIYIRKTQKNEFFNKKILEIFVFFSMITVSFGPLAQSVEQKAFNLCVIGSNPIRPTILDQKNSRIAGR